MGWALGLAVYFIIWWVTLFAVLPFGIQSQHESGEVVEGSDPGAPVTPRMLKRLVINTGFAAVIWAIVDLAYIRYFLG